MQDISLHLLDIIENSVRAGAKTIRIRVINDEIANLLRFIIEDDGCGMDSDTLQMAQDPFFTSKAEREKKVGLGIPLFKQNAELSNGHFTLTSEPGLGTVIRADFENNNIDRLPLGSLKDTLLGAIVGHQEVNFFVNLISKNKGKEQSFHFDTEVIKEELGDIPLTYPDVIDYIEHSLIEGIQNTNMENV